MGRTITALLATAAAATPAYAADGAALSNGLLVAGFFGFAALIIAFQFVPAVALFCAIVKGIVSPGKEATAKVPRK